VAQVFLGIGSSLQPEENFKRAIRLLGDAANLSVVGISTVYWTRPLLPPGSSATGSSPTGSSPTGASPTGASPTGASPTGASPTGASPGLRVGDPDFLNGVMEIQTALSQEELGLLLTRIEDTLGRIRTQDKYAPRTMDLDILLFYREKEHGGDGGAEHARVHPDIRTRAFVAYPLLELAPDTHLPPDGITLREVVHGFPDTGGKADLLLTAGLRANLQNP